MHIFVACKFPSCKHWCKHLDEIPVRTEFKKGLNLIGKVWHLPSVTLILLSMF